MNEMKDEINGMNGINEEVDVEEYVIGLEEVVGMLVERSKCLKNELNIYVEKVVELESKSKGGRKGELEGLLEDGGYYTIKELSKKMGISCKNVSSIICYLKDDGLNICTDSKRRKFIMR